jgi:hypothetical protein
MAKRSDGSIMKRETVGAQLARLIGERNRGTRLPPHRSVEVVTISGAPMHSHQVFKHLALGLLTLAAARADTLHIPGDYATLGAAAVVAVSGDTLLVAPGVHGSFGEVVLRGGVALVSSAGRDSTRLEFGNEGQRLVLLAGSEDTTLVEGFELLFNSGYNADLVVAETPAVIIRNNSFSDFSAYGSGASILLTDGGVVEGNLFWSGVNTNVEVLGGVAFVRGNSWINNCTVFSSFAVGVRQHWSRSDTVFVEIRGNTLVGASVDMQSGEFGLVQMDLVDNILDGSEVACSSVGNHHVSFRYNLLARSRVTFCDSTMGPGNIVWPGDFLPDVLFCEPDNPCIVTIDKNSPVVGAGEFGATLGAYPVGCGMTPIDGYEPAVQPGVSPRVGRPRPNPSSGAAVRIPTVVSEPAIATVFDSAGRRVRVLSILEGAGDVTWDGRDAEGREVPAGVYFLRLGREARAIHIVR